jgi:hypothetical protein
MTKVVRPSAAVDHAACVRCSCGAPLDLNPWRPDTQWA